MSANRLDADRQSRETSSAQEAGEIRVPLGDGLDCEQRAKRLRVKVFHLRAQLEHQEVVAAMQLAEKDREISRLKKTIECLLDGSD